MKLTKKFYRTHFSLHAIRATVEKFDETFQKPQNLIAEISSLSVQHGKEEWGFDNEDDFYIEVPTCDGFTYHRKIVKQDNPWPLAELSLQYFDEMTIISVETKQDNIRDRQRSLIRAVVQVLSDHADKCKLPEQPDKEASGPVIFIGHGRSPMWRDLKDHLGDKHGYRIEAYETGARTGHTIRDILESMLERSSFALLVLTKEDEMANGYLRARQNIVHETGLFQGKLGFARAIVLVEKGTETFTNIAGIERLHFSKIAETYGDVVATLKREFSQEQIT